MNLDETQKRILNNKIAKGFNTTDVPKEFCFLYGEVGEAYEAYFKKKSKEELGLELADVAIYLLGISEILHISLEEEIEKKLQINESRIYKNVNGVLVKKDE